MPQPDFNRTSTPDIGLNTVQFRPLYALALQPLTLSRSFNSYHGDKCTYNSARVFGGFHFCFGLLLYTPSRLTGAASFCTSTSSLRRNGTGESSSLDPRKKGPTI